MTASGIDGTDQPAAIRGAGRATVFFGARVQQLLGRRAATAERLCRRALSYCDYTKAYRLLSELELLLASTISGCWRGCTRTCKAGNLSGSRRVARGIP